jgi:hypothetical protein
VASSIELKLPDKARVERRQVEHDRSSGGGAMLDIDTTHDILVQSFGTAGKNTPNQV